MAKLRKILGKQIKSFEFYRQKVARLYKERTIGFIWLEDGSRIKVEGGKFYILNELGEKSGIILKTNPGYMKIKRMIARWFKSYRVNGNLQHLGYWQSRVIDGIHNVELFKISNISFKNNKSTFLKLAS